MTTVTAISPNAISSRRVSDHHSDRSRSGSTTYPWLGWSVSAGTDANLVHARIGLRVLGPAVAQPGHQLEPGPGRLLLREDGVEGGVQRGPDQDGDRDEVEPDQHRDRCRE